MSETSNIMRGIGNKVVDTTESTSRMTLNKRLRAEGYSRRDRKRVSLVTRAKSSVHGERDKVLDETLKCKCDYLRSLGAEKPLCSKCLIDDIIRKTVEKSKPRKTYVFNEVR